MKEKLAKLIDVKFIVTLVMVIVFAYMTVAGKSVTDQFGSLLMMILSFYFGIQVAKKAGE
jgi:thiamine transporter ThiT